MRAKKRQIAGLVRQAVLAATNGLTSQDEALKLVLELATQAAKSAPEFADTIFTAVSEVALQVPLLNGISGLTERLLAAVTAGADTAGPGSGLERDDSKSDRSRENESRESEYHGRTDDHIVSPSR